MFCGESVTNRAINLLIEKRGLKGHVAADRFVSDFVAYLISIAHTKGFDPNETLDLLENDENLTCNTIFSQNFRKSLMELISPKLRNNALFMEMFPVLMRSNGKGIGIGEMVLPLIISNYRFSVESDGAYGEGKKAEIKKNGASLKPMKTGDTDKGLVDTLNRELWKGTVPGKRREKLFRAHLSAIGSNPDYSEYIKRLYPTAKDEYKAELIAELNNNYSDKEAVCNAFGLFALKQYKSVDGWSNILYIDDENGNIVNISNIDTLNINEMKIKFTPHLYRGRDTQAIADGYVNLTIKK